MRAVEAQARGWDLLPSFMQKKFYQNINNRYNIYFVNTNRDVFKTLFQHLTQFHHYHSSNEPNSNIHKL